MFKQACASFQGYRKPTKREIEYVTEVVASNRDVTLCYIVAFLLTTIPVSFISFDLICMLYYHQTESFLLASPVLYFLYILPVAIWIFSIRLHIVHNRLKKGKFEVLDGTAAYWSYNYSKLKPSAQKKRDTEYWISMTNITTKYGNTYNPLFLKLSTRCVKPLNLKSIPSEQPSILLVRSKGRVITIVFDIEQYGL